MKTACRFGLLCLSPALFSAPNLHAQEDSWKRLANERIQQIRQRDLQIRIVDEQGNPVASAAVELKQTKKAFPFGSAMNRALLSNEKYREFFRQNFNWAVFENESKWYSNEREAGQIDFVAADAMYQWCREQGIPVRGHCVFWEPEKWQTDWVKRLTPSELRGAVERRLNDAMTHFRGKFVHWDVNNEMLHGSFFKDRLGEDIHAWMYKMAHQIDPEAELFVNEFNILSVDQDFQEVEVEQYVDHIRSLQEQGAPIHGVGIQGHIWFEDILSTPLLLKERLDKVASLNLPIWISEFDTADEEENRNAEILELVFRTAYSHSAVEGIMLWAFWAGTAWRGPNSGLVRQDWTLNAAGRRFQSLMQEWSTEKTGVTDAEGIFACRGFYGEYAAFVQTRQGARHEIKFRLAPAPGAHMETVVLPGAR